MAPRRRIPDISARQALVEQLRQEDAVVRQAAFASVEAMARDSRWRARRWAAAIVGTARNELGSESSAALAFWRSRCLPLLLDLLADCDPSVRAYAVMALWTEPASFPAYCEAALRAGRGSRYRLAFGLACIIGWGGAWEEQKPLATEVLLRLLDDKDEEVREWANFALHAGRHDSAALRERFGGPLTGPVPEVPHSR